MSLREDVSQARARGGRRGWRIVVLALRAVAAVCLALIPLGVLDRSPFAPAQYVLVLDDSPSVRRQRPGFVEEALELWRHFDGGGHPVVGVGERPRPAGATGPTAYTDLPAAVRAAATLGASRVETRILLVSDGLSREETLPETIRVLRERKARVWALTPPAPQPRAQIVRLVVPERAFLWEPFPVRAQIAASKAGPLEVQLLRNGEQVATATVAVDASGVGETEFLQEADRVGRIRFAVRLNESDPAPAVGEVMVAQSPRVRWLSDDPAASGEVVGLLRGAGIEVELTNPSDLVAPEQDLARDEVIVLDDLPAPALTEPLVEAVRRAVGERGAGLVVLGGRKGIGSGEYANTPLEALLPVLAGFQSPPAPEAVALVLALDTSFSMHFRGSGERVIHGSEPRKIDVAKDSAREVIRIVRPGDRLGIIGNSTTIFWISPLAEVRDRDETLRRIDRIFADGDGIYFYSVLHEAREALRRDPAGVRHVLVLCDAEDIDQYEVAGSGHSFDLARDMAREGITVSILAIGRPTDKDVPFLRTAALLGRGDFYLVPRIVALPRYFVSEYRRLSSARYFVEEEIQPLAVEQDALPAGTTRELPPLAGVGLVTAREGSRTLLQTSIGAPLLVAGTYGRGRTTVFAADNGYRWAPRWAQDPGLRRFWLQLIFGAAPAQRQSRAFSSHIEADRGRGQVRFHYAGVDGALPAWDALWLLPGDGGTSPALRLDRVGLRAYRGAATFGKETFSRVTVGEDREGARRLESAGYAVPPAEEELPSPARWSGVEGLLKATGGGWVDRPGEIAAPGARPGSSRRWPVLLIACGVLLLLAETVVRTTREG